MDRLETRELVYFLAVAEDLHFRRAAERLGIAQPPLSRAVTRLERRLGVRLLERTSQKVSLTAAGEVLLHEGRKALAAIEAAGRRAQRAGKPDPRLVLVMKAGGDAGLLPDILERYEDEPGAIPVDVVLCTSEDRAPMLRDGQADVGLLHRPHNDLSGLDTEDLLAERQVVVLPARHRLAGRVSVRLADLEGETMPRWPGTSGDGPVVNDSGQLMQLVALGRLVAVLPESVLGQLRQDLVYVPVEDAQATTLVVAWPEQSRSLAVAGFVRAAAAVVAEQRRTRVTISG
jgi:DNA-binding transcriptional LysR family regulator